MARIILKTIYFALFHNVMEYRIGNLTGKQYQFHLRNAKAHKRNITLNTVFTPWKIVYVIVLTVSPAVHQI